MLRFNPFIYIFRNLAYHAQVMLRNIYFLLEPGSIHKINVNKMIEIDENNLREREKK